MLLLHIYTLFIVIITTTTTTIIIITITLYVVVIILTRSGADRRTGTRFSGAVSDSDQCAFLAGFSVLFRFRPVCFSVSDSDQFLTSLGRTGSHFSGAVSDSDQRAFLAGSRAQFCAGLRARARLFDGHVTT